MGNTAVIVCPGRGSYTKAELGYLARHHSGAAVLGAFEAIRAAEGQEALAVLDGAERYSVARHARGDNAAALIHACAFCDFGALAGDVEVLAVTGNSMGWYTALACGGVLSPAEAFRLANTMGTLMHRGGAGGQVVYPVTGADWRPDAARRAELMALVARIGAEPGQALGLSIDLGGLVVLAGDEAGLAAFEAAVPVLEGRYPMRLGLHAAFHTPLVAPVAEQGRAALADLRPGQPRLPLIDGRGAIWWPGASDPAALWDYTLGHQVVAPYDFARAIAVAAREFAPDLFILLGPGASLGGAVAQSLVAAGWRGMADKADFEAEQAARGLIAAMGRADQRAGVV